MLNLVVKDAVPIALYAALHMETMGARIKRLRESRGLTQPALGDLCGVTKSAVSQWEDESTANIKLESFLRLCEALGTDPRYLVWGPERKDPDMPSRHYQR